MSISDIAHSVLHERQSRDQGWYEEIADCLADDSVVEMSWFSDIASAELAVYRCLAWDLNRKGYQIGNDRPEAVQRQYTLEMTWPNESRTPTTTASTRKDQRS